MLSIDRSRTPSDVVGGARRGARDVGAARILNDEWERKTTFLEPIARKGGRQDFERIQVRSFRDIQTSRRERQMGRR